MLYVVHPLTIKRRKLKNKALFYASVVKNVVISRKRAPRHRLDALFLGAEDGT